MMRIGMMADVYKPHISGVTNYLALNKRFLEKAGHEVYLFTFGDLGYQDEETHIIRSPGLPLVDSGYSFNFRYSRQAKDLLQTMDILHVQHPFLSGRLALRYARPLHIPIVFTNHTRYDLYAQAYLPLLPEEISLSFLQAYLPSFCQAVDRVLAPSAGMADILRKLGVSNPIQVIPNGVEISHFQQPCTECRAELGLRKADLLLVYVGRLAPEKNLEFLLQSFLGTAEAVEHAHLLLIGSGPQQETLQQLAGRSQAASRIHFTGQVPYLELPRYLAMADIFVTASVSEVHPLSVIEALASGLPVVGIRSVGIGDTVEEGITGFLSSPEQSAFASKLTRLCLDTRLRQKMSAAARVAVQKYDIERTSQELLDLYLQLVRQAGSHQRGIPYRLRSLLERYRG
jgi:glycosyltransferase involved in cell wall biosynthesis